MKKSILRELKDKAGTSYQDIATKFSIARSSAQTLINNPTVDKYIKIYLYLKNKSKNQD